MPSGNSEKIKYSLVIPCFNEAEGIDELVQNCKPLLASNEVEVILVDNGSTDSSSSVIRTQIARNYGNLRLVSLKDNQGYGGGILAGLSASRGSVIGWTHADLQTNPKDFLKALVYFESETDNVFVKGSRVGRPFSDYVFTLGMGIFETLLLGRALRDINAQPTVFTRKFFDTWSNPPADFSLDLFAYFMAKKSHLRVNRFPVMFGSRKYGVSRWNVNLSAKRRFILRTLKFSFELRKSKSWR